MSLKGNLQQQNLEPYVLYLEVSRDAPSRPTLAMRSRDALSRRTLATYSCDVSLRRIVINCLKYTTSKLLMSW
jgi:hypothetical protein